MRKKWPIILSIMMLLMITLIGCTKSHNDHVTNNPGNTPVVTDNNNTGNNGPDLSPKPNPEPDKPAVVASNDAFRVYGPAPDSEVGRSFTVKGQARVFEAQFSYSFEDGHNVLAEGHVMADKGAPEWGNFEFTVKLDKAPTSPVGTLTIYESSAKDGTPVHELHLTYTFEKNLLAAGEK